MISLKGVAIFIIPYLFLVAGLWHVGYWSTFQVNILQHLEISDIIKSSIYPFLSTTIFVLIGQVAAMIYVSHRSESPREKEVSRKSLFIYNLFLIFWFFVPIIVFPFIESSYRWFFLMFNFGLFAGIILNRRDYFSKYIPNEATRKNLTHMLIIIPFVAFGYAKTSALNILVSNDNCTFVNVITKQPNLLPFLEYKLLGFGGHYVFLMPKNGKDIVMLPESELQSMIYLTK